MRQFLIILVVITLSACATSRGFDRGELRSRISGEQVVTEDEIARALELKPQISAPIRLAVYFKQPASYGAEWLWQGQDKDALMKIGTDLKASGAISEIVPLGSALVKSQDRKSIRLAAARAGADAVLVIEGATAIDRYNNAWGATYGLLVTAIFVPGSVADGLFMANASMWDVRNEYLYLSVEAEGTASETRPALFIEESRVLREAQSAAMAELSEHLQVRLENMLVFEDLVEEKSGEKINDEGIEKQRDVRHAPAKKYLAHDSAQ